MARSLSRVVFVNRFAHPDISATSQLLTDLAIHLAAVRDVHVITSRMLYDRPDATLPAFERVGAVNIHRVWTTRFGRSNLLGRAVDYLTFYASATLRALRVISPHDLVISLTDPPLITVPITWIARLKRAHSANWLQDLFPEVAIELGVVPAGTVSARAFVAVRDWALRRASRNVVIGEHMAERVATRAVGVPVDVVPNWSPDRSIRPLPHAANPLRTEWSLEGRFVVAYSGNMGRAHDFTTILQACERLANHPAIIFLFIGSGNQREAVEKEVASRGLANVLFRDYQPRERLPQSLAAGDVHLISLKPALEGLVMPSKFYGIAAAGRPVLFIGSVDGEIAKAIATFQCGVAIDIGNASALADAILHLSRNDNECRRMGDNARRMFEDHYDTSLAHARWSAALEALERCAR